MNIDELAFFENRPNELEMYETLLYRLSGLGCEYSIRVQKTQISLSNRYMFACVSFARVKKKAELPPNYLVVTFGLNYAKGSGRIAVCTEAARNRWTHHVVIDSVSDIDEELLRWLQEPVNSAIENKTETLPYRRCLSGSNWFFCQIKADSGL